MTCKKVKMQYYTQRKSANICVDHCVYFVKYIGDPLFTMYYNFNNIYLTFSLGMDWMIGD